MKLKEYLSWTMAFTSKVIALLCSVTVFCVVILYCKLSLFENERKVIVLVGDSITQGGFDVDNAGWAAGLSHLYSRKADLFNRGYSGYTSEWVNNNIHHILGTLQPDLALVFLGANDAVYATSQQSVGVQRYSENLKSIVLQIQKRQPYFHSSSSSSPRIILVTPPPIHQQQLRDRYRKRGLESNRDNERTGTYAEAVRELGRAMQLSVVDSYVGMGGTQIGEEGEEARGSYLSDGLHLNARGNRRMLELVMETIRRDLPSWSPENLKNDLFPTSHFYP